MNPLSQIRNYTSHHFIEPLENRLLFSTGDLDASFAGNGKVAATFGDITIAVRDIAVQEDGKTVVVGVSPDKRFAVGRFNVNGTPDTTFGPAQTGLALTQLNSEFGSDAQAVAIYPTGEIVVVGQTTSGHPSFAVAKYLSNGLLDTSFSGNGKWASDLGEYYAQATDVAIQNDGKIVIGGSVLTSFLLNPEDSDFAVVRLLPNGDYDPTFAGDGRRFIGFGNDEYGTALAIDNNGRPSTNPYFGTIAIVGYQQPGGIDTRKFAVARLKPNGGLDGRFDEDGKKSFQFPDVNSSQANSVVFQRQGKMVVVGTVGPDGTRTTSDFAMVRFHAFGAFDDNFGTDRNGQVITDFGGNDRGNDVIIGYNDRLIVGGSSSGKYALAAFNVQGLVDDNFGAGGKVLTQFNDNAGIAGLARGPGNRRFIAGGGAFAARYLDVGANVISITTLDYLATESPVNQASFFVTRVERLPTPLTVGFSVGGTARFTADYTCPNISGPVVVENTLARADAMGPMPTALVAGGPIGDPGGIPKSGQVTILANETFAVVTITPVNDALAEGNETMIATLKDGTNYDISDKPSVTLDIIDDETTTLFPLADALVKQGTNADTNYGTVRTLQSRAKTGNNRRSYLKFDLLGISSNKTITNVKLRLFGNLDGVSNTNIDAGVYFSSNTTWDESTLTWTNKPANGPSPIATATITDQTPRWYEWDVTAFVKSEKEAAYDAITLVLRNTETSDEFASFNSREAKANPPQLVVTYA
jgi:uncharacterized delta-60 repeat protein